MSMQELTSCLRNASVDAAAEKFFDQVHPPSEIKVFRSECCAFSAFNWAKFPDKGAFQAG